MKWWQKLLWFLGAMGFISYCIIAGTSHWAH